MLKYIHYASQQLVRIDLVRTLAFKARAFWYIKSRGLRTLDNPDNPAIAENTIKHNLKNLLGYDTRMSMLFKGLTACECFNPKGASLVVGPRNEHDLLLYYAAGGNWKSVKGVDLISYSPKIDLGDMHSLPYPNNSFDTIICGWTLSYSATPSVAMDEMLRVLRPGGMLAAAVEFSSLSMQEQAALLYKTRGKEYNIGYDNKGLRIINSTEDMLSLLPQGHTALFSHDAPLKRSHTDSELISSPSSVAIIALIP